MTRKYSYYAIILLIVSILSCSKQNETTNFEFGYDFQLVTNDYKNFPLVNSINPTDNINAQHYTFKSPIHNDQEIGFSLVRSKNFIETNNKVYVFLHGQGGSEHSGFVNYIPYLINTNLLENNAVYILLNGISSNGGSWEIKAQNNYYPITSIRECIDGLINSSNFSFLSKNPSDWTIIGFSMGGRAATSLFLNPEFINWPNRPLKIFPMGSWLSSENLNEMIDFDTAISNIDQYIALEPEVTVINHILDRGGDNSTNLKIDISDVFINNLNDEGFNIENTHINEPRQGCLATDPQIDDCNVHVIHHYLDHINPQNTQQTIGELIHN